MTVRWSNCCFAALALSQAEADESSVRMLRRLQTACVVTRVEPSSDALLGFELVESGTCWRPSPKKFWRAALALRELTFGRCRRTGTLKSAAPSGTQCLCSDYDVNFALFSSTRTICDSLWRTCGTRVGLCLAGISHCLSTAPCCTG